LKRRPADDGFSAQGEFPRPPSRGSIEASRSRGAPRSGPGFHGLRAAAPLKPDRGLDRVPLGPGFPRPPGRWSIGAADELAQPRPRTAGFHGLRAVAPLKPDRGPVQMHISPTFPRPPSRGSIEAGTQAEITHLSSICLGMTEEMKLLP